MTFTALLFISRSASSVSALFPSCLPDIVLCHSQSERKRKRERKKISWRFTNKVSWDGQQLQGRTPREDSERNKEAKKNKGFWCHLAHDNRIAVSNVPLCGTGRLRQLFLFINRAAMVQFCADVKSQSASLQPRLDKKGTSPTGSDCRPS